MAEKILIELDVDASGAVKSVTKLNKEVEETGKDLKKTSKGVEGFGKKLKALGAASAVIGLIVGAFKLLKDALGQNQTIVDGLSTAMNAFAIVANDLFKFISDNAQPIIDYFAEIFEHPQQTMKDFKAAFDAYIVGVIEQGLEVVGLLGKAITQLFEGDFAGALETGKEALKETADVFTGVDGTVEKVTKAAKEGARAITDYTKSTISQAKAITQADNSLKQLENTQTRVREQSDRDAERQRQIRDDETKSIAVRIAANEKLSKILDEQQKNEIAAVDAQIAALQQRQKLIGYNQEIADQIYALETERFAVEAQQEGFRSEQLTNRNSLLREQAEALKELEAVGLSEAAQAYLAAEQEYEQRKEIANRYIADEEERKAQLLAIEEDFANKVQGIETKLSKSNLKLKKEEEAAKLKLASSALGAITELAGESSAIGKLAAVSQAVINTYQGVTAALAQTTDVTPTQTLRFANAAAVGIAGALNVKKILSTKTIGNSGGGGGAPSVSTPSAATVTAPSFITQSDTGVNQLGDTISSAINNKPVQAYVTQTDIDNNAQLSRNTQNNAQF